MSYFKRLINFKSPCNEAMGIWTENIMCKAHNIPFHSNREYMKNASLVQELVSDITSVVKFVDIGSHEGKAQAPHDFLSSQGKTISVKTTGRPYSLLCPQKMGQTTIKCMNTILDTHDFRRHIQNNPGYFARLCVEHIFCCDTTIHIDFYNGKAYVIDKTNVDSVVDMRRLTDHLTTTPSWGTRDSTFRIRYRGEAFINVQVRNNSVITRCKAKTARKLIEDHYSTSFTMLIDELTHRYRIRVQR